MITPRIIILLIFSLPLVGLTQSILLDHPVRCGKLQCFPSSSTKTEYYYLPSNPHVVINENNKHEFSFTRYVESADSSGDGGILEAQGGGIIHFLVDYTVLDKDLTAARNALEEINKDAVLKGPILFEAGTFALVSSVAVDEDKPNELSKQVVGVGKAPLIEGLKAAVSIHLTKKGALLLWNSFQMDTPDISLAFEMTFSGLKDPVDATITADWTKLSKQADITFGGKVGYMGIGAEFDYQDFWQEAKNSGAISIEYKGDPEDLQTIVERAYARLHELMFEPIPVNTNEDNQDDSLSALTEALRASANQFGGSNYSSPWEVKLSGGYRRRNLKQSGTYTFDFRQSSKSTITTAMAGNIGSLYRLYGDDPSIFRTINLSDPNYRVREISVALDARDESEFDKYINHVTLTLQKRHGSGDTTPGQHTFNRKSFEVGRPKRITYPWRDETSMQDWLSYEYKADWSFVGGAKFSSGWLSGDSPAIALTPPYQYKEIEFIASEDLLQEADVRLVSIRVEHDFFGRAVKETINLIPSRGEFSAQRIFAVPPGKESIDYTITWTLNNANANNRRRLSSGKLTTEDTIIFADEVPTN